MTEAGYDNGLSNYEWNEEDERENVFFVSLKRQKKKKDAWDDSRSEQNSLHKNSQNVQLDCS